MVIGLEVWKFSNLHIVCDDDKFGSLHVYILCVMMTCLEVWKFTCLHIVCDDDKLEVYKFTHCV